MTRVLLFTRTTDYRHASIEHGAEVLTELVRAELHEVDHTEDPAAFTTENLARYGLVVWLSTSGEVLDGEQRDAFAAWVRGGGRFAGIHCAAASEYTWPEFELLLGAWFTDHPDPQPGVVHRTGAPHPSTDPLPDPWAWDDEWYNFRHRPGPDRTVLLTVDEGTYDGGTMGADHPIAWHGPYGAGHTWYTALGHHPEHYDDPLLRAHLLGGLRSLLDDDGPP